MTPSANSRFDSARPSLDQLVEEIAGIDLMIDQHRALNDAAEARLFGSPCEGDARKGVVLSIALRDELIDELLARRSLLIRLLAG